jgi:hypothetical protein
VNDAEKDRDLLNRGQDSVDAVVRIGVSVVPVIPAPPVLRRADGGVRELLQGLPAEVRVKEPADLDEPRAASLEEGRELVGPAGDAERVEAGRDREQIDDEEPCEVVSGDPRYICLQSNSKYSP